MSVLSLQYPLNFLGFMIMFSLMFTNMFRDARAFLASIFLVLVLASMSIAHAQTAGFNTSSTIESGVDTSIKPGDDFFGFANGAWLKATDIPAGKARWTVRDEIAELTRQQVLKLLDGASAAPAGSTARKVADFRAAYLNEAAIEAKGSAPLKPMLDRIDRVRDRASLTQLLGAGLRADVDPMNTGVFRSSHILGLAVQASIHGEKDYVAFLVQGGLGLADRENYMSAEPAMQVQRTKRQEAIGRVLALLSADSAAVLTKRAEAVMALETAIAQSHATAELSGNERSADNLWTRADLAQQAPGIDWSEFFTAAGLGKQQTFVAWQPSAVKGMAALVVSQPLQAWKDYLRVRLVDIYADVLPRAFAEQASALRGTIAAQSARTQRATEATQAAMSDAIGRIYVERHFPATHKTRVQAITANVIAAFTRRVEAATWLSPASRTQALAKLKAVYFGVGYPEKWTDYSHQIVNSADAVGNLQRISEFQCRDTVAKLGKPVDKTEWSIAPQRAGAVLLFQQNSYNFAAALLQLSKFDPTASDAANYGAIGAIVGHEVSHLVDTLGAEYEADGRFRRWWTAEDMSQYEALTAPLIKQVASYRPVADVAINGKVTLVENLADLGGLAAAFDAHRVALGDRTSDKEYVRQQDRQFFLGFARSWRGKMTEAALRKYLANDNHAPENYRIAIVRNIDAWYDAFDVQPGNNLYLEPKSRVRIW
jgi:putative endopeptidase